MASGNRKKYDFQKIFKVDAKIRVVPKNTEEFAGMSVFYSNPNVTVSIVLFYH